MVAPITIDFETKSIKPRPDYPPAPVGVGIWTPGSKPKYFGWGHKGGGNNCTKAEGKRQLVKAWRSGRPLLFHHAKFDLDVAEEFFGMKMPDPERVLCTMIEAFLFDPNETNLGLKELCEKLLGIPPTERDHVRDWLYQHIPGMRRKKKQWAAHIWMAPCPIVGPYCCSDLQMTRKLHDYIYPWIVEMSMKEAYLREQKLSPILIEMERFGVPIDVDRLARNIGEWEHSQETADQWIRKRLGRRDLSIDSNEDLADAIERKDKVNEWILTDHKDAKRSVSIEALDEVLLDRELFSVLRYRASLSHSLRTNARPWLEMAQSTGKIFTIWNQVRQADAGTGKRIGARTGRLSSKPNFQNLSNKPLQVCFSKAEANAILAADDEAKILILPLNLQGKIIPLPWMRDYITAPKKYVLLDRDYAQQEPRILAHFVEGDLLDIYRNDPKIDFHGMATKGLNDKLGTHYSRKNVKQVVLAIIYARGIPALAEQFGIEESEARSIKAGIKDLFPGIQKLERDLRKLAALNEPFHTWGGRVCYCEPPKEVKGQWRSWEYKMINTLIQGSAADNTKEAMIRYHQVAKDGRMLLQVHDELLIMALRRTMKAEMKILREAMESVEFDVPMLTDGEWGPTWGQLQKFEEVRKAA